MDIIFFLSLFCLIAFMILATYDGAYLHLWKYELFNRDESKFEHLTHTIRALLFPVIVYLLFVDTSIFGFWIGLTLVGIDMIVLGIDAYSEKESRSFMNGLPQWEYIVHVFSNSFHFAAIMLMIATRTTITADGIFYTTDFMLHSSYDTVQFIAINIIPGAVILGLIHLLLSFDFGRRLYNSNRLKITCC